MQSVVPTTGDFARIVKLWVSVACNCDVMLVNPANVCICECSVCFGTRNHILLEWLAPELSDMYVPLLVLRRFGIDMWGAGCIVAELFVGKPILRGSDKGSTQACDIDQYLKICELCGE